MERFKQYKEILEPLLDVLAEHAGDNTEYVLHDLTQGYDSTIVAIRNGHITGRKVGDPGSNLGLEVLRGTITEHSRTNYFTRTRDGKTLRSSTLYIQDEKDVTIGSVCINTDISSYLLVEDVFKSLTMLNDNHEVNEIFVNDVNELLEYFLAECQTEIGKPVEEMSREDKIEALKYLDDKGVFLISKSGPRVCEFFDFSKYTLYSYLEQARNSDSEEL